MFCAVLSRCFYISLFNFDCFGLNIFDCKILMPFFEVIWNDILPEITWWYFSMQLCKSGKGDTYRGIWHLVPFFSLSLLYFHLFIVISMTLVYYIHLGRCRCHFRSQMKMKTVTLSDTIREMFTNIYGWREWHCTDMNIKTEEKKIKTHTNVL